MQLQRFLSGILLGLFVLMSSVLVEAQDQYKSQQIEVSLRMIGHRILLNAGDSTSRVLPIKKEENKYSISFDVDLGFNPDSLISTVNQVMMQTAFASAYFLEVEECSSKEIVYSYKMGSTDDISILPCGKRDLPRSCYSLLLTLIKDIDMVAVGSDSRDQRYDTALSGFGIFSVVLILLIIVIARFVMIKRKSIFQQDANLIPLGAYWYDKTSTNLLYEDHMTELTSKEADLLMLLYDAVNTIVEREQILKKVWGDEGDYIGRTVDVFISKLRKKLILDSNIKIENVRGVGYKLVLNT